MFKYMYNHYFFLLLLVIVAKSVAFIILTKNARFVNVFDALESSPLFDFSIDLDCGNKSHLVFYIWKVQIEERDDIFDTVNIEKINGYYFCYKHKSYKELLSKNQIKKYGEKCGDFYPKDCGIIDTSNQHLCVEDTEKCPLYDIGIGERKISAEYDYNENAKVYYNNDNYNKKNKKILGKLLLSQGQPCYSLNEILWRKFNDKKEISGNLECKLNIFDKMNDDRFKNKGNIEYKQLYEDNLSEENQNVVMKYIKGNEIVSLFTREFIGIDLSCNRKYNFKKDYVTIIRRNQNNERICFFVEFFIMSSYLSLNSKIFGDKNSKWNVECVLASSTCLIFIIPVLLTFIICKSIFLGEIINHNLSYNCSDMISNEVFRKENENTAKSILFFSIDLIIEIFIFLFISLYLSIFFLCRKEKQTPKENNNKIIINQGNNPHHNNCQSQIPMNPSNGVTDMLNKTIKRDLPEYQKEKSNASSHLSDQTPPPPPNDPLSQPPNSTKV